MHNEAPLHCTLYTAMMCGCWCGPGCRYAGNARYASDLLRRLEATHRTAQAVQHVVPPVGGSDPHIM